jgi:HEAT repeat protein
MNLAEQLIGDSQTGDVDTRKKAIRQLAYQPESIAFDTLIEVLFDPDDGIRLAALEALEARGDKRAVSYILKLACDPDLFYVGDDDEHAWNQSSEFIERALVSFGSEVVDELMAYRHRVISGLITALGKIGDKRALKPLQNMALGVDLEASGEWGETHRHEAIRALGYLGDISSFDLLNAIALDKNHRHQSDAIYALGGLKDDRAIPTLLKKAAEPDIPPVVSSGYGVLATLRELGSPASHQALISLARDKEARIRPSAILFLRELNTPEALDVLVDITTDLNETESGWKFAIQALTNKPPFDRLKRVIPDLPPERRREALARIGDR